MANIQKARRVVYKDIMAKAAASTVINSSRLFFDTQAGRDPDAGLTPGQAAGQPWFVVNVRHIDNRQESLGREGNRRFTIEAILFIRIFSNAQGVGPSVVDPMAVEFQSFFDSKEIVGSGEDSDVRIAFEAMQINDALVGRDDKNSVILIELPFRYYSVR